MIDEVATISTNNDPILGELIADAYRAVDLTGVVMMETSQDGETSIEIVEGVQYEKGFTNNHFVTNAAANTAELINPKILLVDSAIDSIRQIQTILEHVIKNNIPLLIVGDVEAKVAAALAMNKNMDKDAIHFPKKLQHYSEIYIGHTPTTNYGETKPMNAFNVWNIDTGAAFKGPLSVIEASSKEVWQSDPVWHLYPDEEGRNK